MRSDDHLVLIHVIWLFIAGFQNVEASCEATLYVGLYQTGVVRCDVDTSVYDIYWYATVSEDPVVRCYLQNGELVLSGPGYDDGSYNIGAGGSLIIKNATRDESYKLLQVRREDTSSSEYQVELKIVVTPSQPYPRILQCEGQSPPTSCVRKASDTLTLDCSVSGARPEIDLSWSIENRGQQEAIETVTKYSVADGRFTYTSFASIDVAALVRDVPLIRFVCVASGPALGSRKLEATVLLDNFPNASGQKSIESHQINNQAKLSCGLHNENTTYIWEKTVSGQTEVLFTSISEDNDSQPAQSRYVTGDGSLVLKQLQMESAGEYTCKSYDGARSHVSTHVVHVVVPPSPPFIVAGCPKKSTGCEIETVGKPTTFTVGCSVHGVYPALVLDLENKFPDEMTIWGLSNSTIPAGNGYNVTITAKLEVHSSFSCNSLRYIRCKASGPGANAISKISEDINIYPDSTGECERPTNVQPQVAVSYSITVILVVLVVIVVIIIIRVRRPCNSIIMLRNVRYYRNRSRNNSTGSQNRG